MDEIVFHYTSRSAGQDIAISRVLRPANGKLYLTPDVYDRGYEAAEKLAMVKVVEVVCQIPASGIEGLSSPRPVGPFRGPDGEELRPGGGFEVIIGREVALHGDEKWHLLDAP